MKTGWQSVKLALAGFIVPFMFVYAPQLMLINTTLAFEYADVDAEIVSSVDSVFNPKSGAIRAERIGELILEKDRIDPGKTKIVCSDIVRRSDRPAWAEEAR